LFRYIGNRVSAYRFDRSVTKWQALSMGPMVCAETSVTCFQPTPRKSQKSDGTHDNLSGWPVTLQKCGPVISGITALRLCLVFRYDTQFPIVLLLYLIKHHCGSGILTQCILNGCIAWGQVISFIPRLLLSRVNFPATHSIRGCIGSRAGLNAVANK